VTHPRDLLSRPAPEIAPRLLGWQLGHRSPHGSVVVELTEVEAYDGEGDPASHAARGRTPRNQVMYGAAGRLYVYFSYGMHWCANVVCGEEGTASAVLLRAGRVIEGVDLARSRRPPGTPDNALARGPACLTQALGINRAHNGADLFGTSDLALTPGDEVPTFAHGPRVGVSLAAETPWRYWIADDPTVSSYKRSPRAAALG
jgi:DNA-3-methyladenine glycosylase